MVKKQNCVIWIETLNVSLYTDDINKEIVEDAGNKFYTSNYELDRQLPKGKNKKVVGLIER